MTSTTSTAVGGPEAAAILTAARRRCEPLLVAAVATLADPLRHMAGYHFGWWDAEGRPTRAQSGKALRPALVLCAATAGGGAQTSAAYAAAAVELIHNFSLLHDDVMDQDTTRRGRATVWAVWGVDDAILLGDALHALAVYVLATGLPGHLAATAIARLEQAAIELCRGQAEDCSFESRAHVSVDEYLHMAMGKTGALTGCACALGALCAAADEDTVSAMDLFGRELGVAFQCADDLLGIWGDPAVTGKPVGADLVRRKRSLPVVAALASGGAAADELARLYQSDSAIDPVDLARAVSLVESAGGRWCARQHAEQRRLAAVSALPECAAGGGLPILAHLATHRDR